MSGVGGLDDEAESVSSDEAKAVKSLDAEMSRRLRFFRSLTAASAVFGPLGSCGVLGTPGTLGTAGRCVVLGDPLLERPLSLGLPLVCSFRSDGPFGALLASGEDRNSSSSAASSLLSAERSITYAAMLADCSVSAVLLSTSARSRPISEEKRLAASA